MNRSNLEWFLLNLKSLLALWWFGFWKHLQKRRNVILSNWLFLVSLSQVDLFILDFFWSNYTNEIESVDLCVSHLLGKLVSWIINGDAVVVQQQRVVYLFSKLLGLLSNRDKLNLSWRKPEVPFSTSLLTQNGNESFKRTENGSVDNDGPGKSVFQWMNYAIFWK